MIEYPPERDANGDVVEDRTILTYHWYDPAYGIGSRPGVSVIVRHNPAHQSPEFILHELTRGWLAISRAINDGGTIPNE